MEFTKMDVRDYPRFLALYNEAFPREERRLYRDEKAVDTFINEHQGKFHGIAAKDGELFIGFLTYWTFKGYVYIEHFAISPEFRGRNIGRKLLHHVMEEAGQDVLIEVEPPVTDIAKRRIRFYEDCGFVPREEVKYIQPPYSPDQKPVKMLLMTHGNVKLDSHHDIAEMLREVYNVEKD